MERLAWRAGLMLYTWRVNPKGKTLACLLSFAMAVNAAGLEIRAVGEEAFSSSIASVPFPTGLGSSAKIGVKGTLGVLAEFRTTKIVDLMDVTNPRIYNGPTLGQGQVAQSIAIVGNYAYVGSRIPPGGGTVYVLDCANRQNARIVGSFAGGYDIANGEAFAIESEGSAIWTLENPITPQRVTFPDEPDWFACDFAASGNRGVRAEVQVSSDGEWGYILGPTKLRLFDLSTPLTPRELGFSIFNVSGAPSITMDGDFAYLSYDYGAGHGVLWVIDLSDRSRPASRGTMAWSQLGTRDPVSSMLARGGFLHILDIDGRLTIIDVRDPYYPRKIAGPLMAASSLCESGGRVFVSTASRELRVYDRFPNVRFGTANLQSLTVTGPQGFSGALETSTTLEGWTRGETFTFGEGMPALGVFGDGPQAFFRFVAP